MENVEAKAKIEVHAWAQNFIQRAGIAALTNGQGPLMLGGGDDQGGQDPRASEAE